MNLKKSILSLCVISALSFTSYTQTVNNIPIKDIDVEYVQIVGTSRLFSSKVNVQIDFGQRNKIFSSKDTRIVDKDGRDVNFNSMVDALNFMSANGYEFVQAYAFAVNDQNVYHYLLRKKKDEIIGH